MRSPDIVFKVYTKEPNKGSIIMKGRSLKSLLYQLNMITRIYHNNKLKKEVRIYPEKRTGKNDHAGL